MEVGWAADCTAVCRSVLGGRGRLRLHPRRSRTTVRHGLRGCSCMCVRLMLDRLGDGRGEFYIFWNLKKVNGVNALLAMVSGRSAHLIENVRRCLGRLLGSLVDGDAVVVCVYMRMCVLFPGSLMDIPASHADLCVDTGGDDCRWILRKPCSARCVCCLPSSGTPFRSPPRRWLPAGSAIPLLVGRTLTSLYVLAPPS